MSINILMDKENVPYINNGILFSHKKKEILSFVATWMCLEGIMLSEIKKKTKTRTMISLICGIKKKNN